jgi:hypothetical protein
MAIEQKLFKCEPSDPNRCTAKGDGGEGQCVFLAVEGQKTCAKHAGLLGQKRLEQKRVSDYRLQQWQSRVDEFSASDNVRSLRSEIGILRMMLETTFNQCRSDMDLMLYSSKIADMVMKIDRVVASCAKLEDRQGNLLDKSAVLILAGQIVDAISRHVTDIQVVDDISNEIINLVAKLAGKELEE